MFHDNFKKLSKVSQECFNKVLFCDFVVAWFSSQLSEQGLVFITHLVTDKIDPRFATHLDMRL